MRLLRKILNLTLLIIILFLLFVWVLSFGPNPEKVEYGVSFNSFYAKELGLDWKAVYRASLNELGFKHFRLSAHWPTIEPQKDFYDFSELDYQVETAEQFGADVIIVLGRRTPRWPECHVPGWAQNITWEDQKNELRQIVRQTVQRYKDKDNLIYWQVENEPYLGLFANEYCGDLDEEFLKEEVEIVRELDPNTPILITDSGNLGLWYNAHKLGDAFGTSAYLYLWNPEIGPIKSRLPASFYKAKLNFMELLNSEKPAFLIELAVEPWLTVPIIEASVETQLERMDADKFAEIIEFGKNTGLEKQYLWGVEWWYWMKDRGHAEFWNKAKEIL